MSTPAKQPDTASGVQLNADEAADILLALIADRGLDADDLSEPDLRGHWLALGLRGDDLLQGLVALARDGRVRRDDGSDRLMLSGPAAAAITAGEHALARLPARLRTVLATAGSRTGDGSTRTKSGERRDGFG